LSDDLMTIRDLADRWGVSVEKAKKHVKARQVPFIRIGDADMRVNWSAVRFRGADVTRWEQDAVDVFPTAEPVKAPALVGKRHKHTRIR
jgi:hypothetical protein